MAANDQRKVKIGVVGCGAVATAYYLLYLAKMQDAELTAVCDLVPARTEACQRLFGAKETYQDYYAIQDYYAMMIEQQILTPS